MPVNTSNAKTAPSVADTRLYLKEDELDRAADLLFAATRRLWASAEGPLDARGLGPAHYRALAAIRREPGLTPGRLMARLGVRKQSLARVLNDLDAARLVRRLPGEADRRERRLELTETGAEAEEAASAVLRERLAKAFRACGPEAVGGLRRVLDELALGVQEEP